MLCCGLNSYAVGLESVSTVDVAVQEGVTDTDAAVGASDVSGQEVPTAVPSEEDGAAELVNDGAAESSPEDEESAASTSTDGQTPTIDESGSQELETQAEEQQTEELQAQSTVAEAKTYASKHKNDIADGRYAISTKLDATYALDVKGGSTANGAALILYTAKTSDNQRWEIEHTSDGFVTIKSVKSGKYLQAGWNGTKNTVVQNARNTSERGQLWIVSRESDGSYKITSALDLTRCLDVKGGKAGKSVLVIVYPKSNDGGAANRRWNLTVTTDILDSMAKSHATDVKDGTYIFSCAASTGLALDMTGASTQNSARAILGSKGPTLSQGWTIRHTSDGYATIINVKSGKALDVRGGKATSGAAIIQWTDKKGSARNQLWIVSKASNGTVTFTSALTEGTRCVLSVSGSSAKANATLELLAKSAASSVQGWSVANAPSQYPYVHDVEDGTYLIATALDSSKVLDVSSSSTKEGAGVKLYTSKSSANQMWRLTHDEQGRVHLTNVNSGKELTYKNDALVQSSSTNGWVFEKTSGGQYYIRKIGTGKYLDVKRSNVDNKTNQVILYAKGSGKNQKWSLSDIGISPDMPIMGAVQISQAQAVRYLNKHFADNGQKLPKKWTDDGETVASLVKYFWEEGEAEGVRGDIALAQSIHETGWFQFGGLAKPEWYNFAGLGVTGEQNEDGSYKGERFKNARLGIRAQIQHLKAYASTEPLNQTCIDNRFHLVERGCAPTIRGLTGKWAVPGYSDVDGKRIYYHDYIVNHLKGMMQS